MITSPVAQKSAADHRAAFPTVQMHPIQSAHESVQNLRVAALEALAHLEVLLESDARLDDGLMRNALHLHSRLSATLEDANRTILRLGQMAEPPSRPADRPALRVRPVTMPLEAQAA